MTMPVQQRQSFPFWSVTLLSGSITLLTALLLLLQASVTNAWQYIALAGGTGVLLFVHGVISWHVWNRRPRLNSICFLVPFQLIYGVSVPLLISDAWLVVLMFLFTTPFLVGIANQVQQIPRALVATLISAVLMVSADLFESPFRLTIATPIDHPLIVIAVLAALQLVISIFLLWYLRLRASSPYAVHLDLTTQLTLLFAAISAGSIIIVTGVFIQQIQEAQIAQVGQTFQTAAETEAERVGNILEEQINALANLMHQEPFLVALVKTSNDRYPSDPEKVDAYLQAQEERWQNSPDDSEFVLKYRSGLRITAFNRFRGTHTLHNNIFLTDRRGALVASQGKKPGHFWYGDQEWWQRAWNHGQGDIVLSDVIIDPDRGTASLFIALRVINPKTNEPIGVLASTYDLVAIQQLIDIANTGTQHEVVLIGPDGTIIAGAQPGDIGRPVWNDLLDPALLEKQAIHTNERESKWLLNRNRNGSDAVVAYANLSTTSQINLKALQGLGWRVVVNDTQANALTHVVRSTKVATQVGLLVMAVGVFLTTATARVIARPIQELTETAKAINQGNLDLQVKPSGSIELITLAEAFNLLTSGLRGMINNLEHMVSVRTAQLAQANQEITALNTRLEAENVRMSTELDVTRQLQQMVLPTGDELRQVPQLDIAGIMQPADEVGGDYYDVLADDDRIIISIGDVTGHGLASGVLMLMTQMGVRMLSAGEETDPVRSLDILNRALYRNVQRMQTGKNLTLALLSYVPMPQHTNGSDAEVIEQCGIVHLAGQHEDIIVVRRDGTIELIDTSDLGVPLGIDEHITDLFAIHTITLCPGDGLVLYTDGITEAANDMRERYGVPRLCEQVREHWHLPSQAITQAVLADVCQYIGEQKIRDDMTLLIIKQR